MVERGSLIVPQKSANNKIIGMRDATELDDASRPRLIQLVDFAEKKLPSPMGSATRVELTAADPLSLLSLPAEIVTNLITCGDAATLVVFAEFQTSMGSQSVTIIPLIFDDEASPAVMFALSPQTIGIPGVIALYRTTGSLGLLGPQKTWDIAGASRIGLMVSAVVAATNVSLWGYVI